MQRAIALGLVCFCVCIFPHDKSRRVETRVNEVGIHSPEAPIAYTPTAMILYLHIHLQIIRHQGLGLQSGWAPWSRPTLSQCLHCFGFSIDGFHTMFVDDGTNLLTIIPVPLSCVFSYSTVIDNWHYFSDWRYQYTNNAIYYTVSLHCNLV